MKQVLCLSLSLIFVLSLPAQSKVQHDEEESGTITGPKWENVSKYIETHCKLSKAKAASLVKALASTVQIIFDAPVLHKPQGFNLRTICYAETPDLAEQKSLTDVSIKLNLYYLNHDAKTGKTVTSMDGTSFTIEANNIGHICKDQGFFAEDCKKLNIPVFFEQLPVTDSTADYIELNFKNYSAPHTIPDIPIRIILRNKKPVFIPFSRKEYLKYLIVKKTFEIKEAEMDMKTFQQNLVQLKADQSNTLYDSSMKAAFIQSAKNLEAQMPQYAKRLAELKGQLQHYKELVNTMPESELIAPAWIDLNRMDAKMDYLDMLVPYGQHRGTALYKINPDYFDDNINAPGVQLVIIYYNWPKGIFIQDPDYLQQKTMKLFEQIDYHSIKESMR